MRASEFEGAESDMTLQAHHNVTVIAGDAGQNTVELSPTGSGWDIVSDRNAKENFQPLDCRALLDKLAAIPVTTWNLKSQPPAVRHIGPMAQDFKAAFGVGEDDKHISTSDADGVAFAAIQGLYQALQDREKEIA